MKNLRPLDLILTLFLCSLFAAGSRAATFVVANTNDSGAGSLRQALLDANVNNEDDLIEFDPTVFGSPQTIILTSGELSIGPDNAGGTGPTKTLIITGPGANLLTISGNNQSRVVSVERDCRATLSGVKITQGNGLGGTDFAGAGGGILVKGGTPGLNLSVFTLKDSIVTGNISGNLTTTGFGGGIAASGQNSVVNSAIYGNSALVGGGIAMPANLPTLFLLNSTVSNNIATGNNAGGIYNGSGDLYLVNSTVAFNAGGGISNVDGGFPFGSPAFAHPRNSIVTNNNSLPGASENIRGRVRSLGHNIIGTGTLLILEGDTSTDLVNVDPQLDPQLSNNGGIIPSHALSSGSPAVDGGDNCVLTPIAAGGCGDPVISFDARGISRPQDANGDGNSTIDIGAFEITPLEFFFAPGIADLAEANDSGFSSVDNITKDRNLSFEIPNIAKGATVEFFRNGLLIGSTVATGNTVSFQDNDLPQNGSFIYYARQTFESNVSVLSPSLKVVVDNTAPGVTINQAPSQLDPTRSLPINFAIGLTEPVVGFDSTDISLSGSTAGVSGANIGLSGSGTAFSASVGNLSSDGTVVATMPSGLIADLAGNVNNVSTSTDNSITYDTAAPTVTINQAAAQTDPTRFSSINFTVVYSEPVTGFTNADVSLAGSTANVASAAKTVTGSGTTYNVVISNLSSNGGTVVASIPALAAQDAAGNLSQSSTSSDNSVTLDNISPSVIINQSAGQGDPTNALPINFTVVFSEAVTGFDSVDISFSGSTISTAAATVNITGSGSTYNVAVGNLTSNGGLLRASVLSGAATDSAGNLSIGSSSTDNTVVLDNVAPNASINQAIGQPDPTSVQPVKFTVVFSEVVTGFNASDVTLLGSTANVSSADIIVTGTGNVYTVTISDIRSSGQVKASVLAGAAQDLRGNTSPASTSTDNTITVTSVSPPRADFDGDGKTDISVFRPSDGNWYIYASTAGVRITNFGSATDALVPGDYDGDGKTDTAIFRASTGEWQVLRSSDSTVSFLALGMPGDKAVAGDYDGDGKTDQAIYRPSQGLWAAFRSSNGTVMLASWGNATDVPVPGDYDGDGKTDVGVYRNGDWYVFQSTAGPLIANWGVGTDKPVPADYDGDGKDDLAIYRPSQGLWAVYKSSDNDVLLAQWGNATDVPVPGDYDGDGSDDFAVYRNGDWFVYQSTAGPLIANWGNATDTPIPAKYLP